MKLATFLSIKAVISIIFAVVLILTPAFYMSLAGVAIDEVGVNLARLVGAMLFGIAMMCWLLRSTAASEARRAALLGLFCADTLGFVISLIAQFRGLYNALGWINVILWFLLALGLGYFCFIKTAEA
jgi:hypothetical protein